MVWSSEMSNNFSDSDMSPQVARCREGVSVTYQLYTYQNLPAEGENQQRNDEVML